MSRNLLDGNETIINNNIPKINIGLTEEQYQEYLGLKHENSKLIDKLKQDIKTIKEKVSYYENARRECEVDSFYYKSHQTTIHKLNAKREYAEKLLEEMGSDYV